MTKLEGLETLTELKEFDISENGLTKIEGLENNVSSERERYTSGQELPSKNARVSPHRNGARRSVA